MGNTETQFSCTARDKYQDIPEEGFPDVSSWLETVCAESGAEYALFWAVGNGSLRVVANSVPGFTNDTVVLESFVELSRSVTLSQGEGLVGHAFKCQQKGFNNDVCNLPASQFTRCEMAKTHGVRSIAFIACSLGVLEYGTTATWESPPPLSGVSSLARVVDSFKHISVWKAVVWKRSQYCKIWRERSMELAKTPVGWQLSSHDLQAQRCTGKWELRPQVPDLSLGYKPISGFLAELEIQGVMLAADTETETAELEKLCRILNGQRKDFDCIPPASTQCPSSPSSSPSLEPSTPFPGLPSCQSSDGGESKESPESEFQLTDSVMRMHDIDMQQPLCEVCNEFAKGQLVVYPSNCLEALEAESLSLHPDGSKTLRRWLCKACFVSSWPGAAADDGRWRARPTWLMLKANGALIDCTPPTNSRYARVCRK